MKLGLEQATEAGPWISRRRISFEICCIDHDDLLLGALEGQSLYHPREDRHVTPSLPTVIEGLRRSILTRGIALHTVTNRLVPPAGFRREALRHVHSDVANDVFYVRRGDAGRSSGC